MTYKNFDSVYDAAQFLVNLNENRLNFEIFTIWSEFQQSPIWWSIFLVWLDLWSRLRFFMTATDCLFNF